MVSNAGIQTVAPVDEFDFAKWKQLLAIHLDGAFLTTRATLREMYRTGRGGSIIYMGSVHSKEASALKAPYVTAKHGLIGLAKVVAKEGVKHGVRANVICPGFVRTPLVDKQIPEQAKELGISDAEVIRNVMLKDTVDGEFTTAGDVAQAALFFASFGSNALTGQSLVVSHGWFRYDDARSVNGNEIAGFVVGCDKLYCLADNLIGFTATRGDAEQICCKFAGFSTAVGCEPPSRGFLFRFVMRLASSCHHYRQPMVHLRRLRFTRLLLFGSRGLLSNCRQLFLPVASLCRSLLHLPALQVGRRAVGGNRAQIGILFRSR